MEIVEFLTTCLAEDERIARATLWDDDSSLGSGRWIAYDRGPRDGFREARWVVIDGADEGVVMSRPQAADDEAVVRHIAEHDPARVLREVEMKRSLVAAYADMLTVGPDIEGGYKRPIREALARHAPNFLMVLALPFADRPGFAEAIASVE